MKILAIGAHPDDIEIFMYGLVSTYKREGNKVFTIVATDGSKGGSLKDDLLSKRREKEAIAGLKKISKPIFLNIPDGELGVDPEHRRIIKESILKSCSAAYSGLLTRQYIPHLVKFYGTERAFHWRNPVPWD